MILCIYINIMYLHNSVYHVLQRSQSKTNDKLGFASSDIKCPRKKREKAEKNEEFADEHGVTAKQVTLLGDFTAGASNPMPRFSYLRMVSQNHSISSSSLHASRLPSVTAIFLKKSRFSEVAESRIGSAVAFRPSLVQYHDTDINITTTKNRLVADAVFNYGNEAIPYPREGEDSSLHKRNFLFRSNHIKRKWFCLISVLFSYI